MNDRILYIAEVSACINPEKDIENSFSDSIGRFLVEPVFSKNILNKSKLIGYREAVTGEMVKIYKGFKHHGYCDVKDFYGIAASVGELAWEIKYDYSTYNILTKETIDNYLNQSPESVKAQLSLLEEEARNMAREENKIEELGRIPTR